MKKTKSSSLNPQLFIPAGKKTGAKERFKVDLN